jgi:LAO/AO transport system kinase
MRSNRDIETDGEPQRMARALRAGDRRALARAITLVESTRTADREKAEALLSELLSDSGRARRIGISGAPGAGKSTFIEAFGGHVTSLGLRVAVLAIDPSSQRSGGSILGDKTRMDRLSRDPKAFIRPSPSGGTLGGVARRTREALLLVEAAGFDLVVVETVGVGQSETAVAEMVDLFVLLVSPGGGDDLQGIKRGVMELADMVLVTKGDGDLLPAANRAAAEYRSALHLMQPKYPGLGGEVLTVSSLTGQGISAAWERMAGLHAALDDAGHLQALRRRQAVGWFWTEFRAILLDSIETDAHAKRAADALESGVAEGRILPYRAARELLAAFTRT